MRREQDPSRVSLKLRRERGSQRSHQGGSKRGAEEGAEEGEDQKASDQAQSRQTQASKKEGQGSQACGQTDGDASSGSQPDATLGHILGRELVVVVASG